VGGLGPWAPWAPLNPALVLVDNFIEVKIPLHLIELSPSTMNDDAVGC